MARSAIVASWAPGSGGDLVITDPTRSPLLQCSARHTPAIASSQTPSKKKVHDYAVWAREALDLQGTDAQAALTAWQKLFGDEFAADEVKAAQASLVHSKSLQASTRMVPEQTAPDEEFIHDKATIERRYDARIDATIIGKYSRSLRKARVVPLGRELRFHLRTDVPEPYEVWWKVRNRGTASERACQLRGQIMRHGNVNRNLHKESTKYPGQHYIEPTSSATE